MKDILIDKDTAELRIVNGDLDTGICDGQNQELLMGTNKGEWKEHPRVGVGLFGFLNEESPDALLAEIREQFKMDGMTVKEIKVMDNKKIGIDAAY